jgi:hypothetical protein
MARRRLKHVQVGRCAVDIYRDSETRELVVRTTHAGKRDSGSFHEDMRDARGTAAHQVRWLRNRRWCRESV